MPITEAQKRAKDKYREANRDKFRIYAQKATAKYYETHKDKMLSYQRDAYEQNRDEIKQRVLNNYYYKKENDINEYFKTLRKMKLF